MESANTTVSVNLARSGYTLITAAMTNVYIRASKTGNSDYFDYRPADSSDTNHRPFFDSWISGTTLYCQFKGYPSIAQYNWSNCAYKYVAVYKKN